MSATPPTTPPTIAPVLFCCSGKLTADGPAGDVTDVAEEADSSAAVEDVESGGIVDIAGVTCRDVVDEVRWDVMMNVAWSRSVAGESPQPL